MPRRAARNVFDVDRDVDADQPRPAQQTDGAGGEKTGPGTLAGLLPKVTPSPPPAPRDQPIPTASKAATEDDRAEDQAGSQAAEGSRRAEKASGPTKASRPRGVGGRPTAESDTAGGIARVPVRVPADLYERALPLVKGVGRPSWGQLVAWTCQDHPARVLEQIAQQAGNTTARTPRGQNRLSTASHTVNARMDAAELDDFNKVLAEADKKSPATRGAGPVTRTAVVLAALVVATEPDLAADPEAGPGAGERPA